MVQKLSRPILGIALASLSALPIFAFGLRAGFAQEPKDRAAWYKQIDAALEAGMDLEALKLISQAAKAIPDETKFKSAAGWFERHGEKRIKEKGYDAALAVAERALKVLPSSEHMSIITWRISLYRYWSQDLLDKKDVDGSLKVLTRGYELYPDDQQIHIGIAYHAQEALAVAGAKSADAVIAQFQALRKQFPKVEDIPRRGQRQTALAIQMLVQEKKFKEAIAAVDQYAPLLTKPEQRAEMGGIAYEGWALHLADKKEWEPALAKYAEGLKAYPDHARLQRNALIVVEDWVEPAITAKKWDEAIRIYDIALKHFPNNPKLQERKQECEKMKK